MAAKRILLLEGSSLTAHEWSAGRIRTEGEFGHDSAGLERFANHLRKHRSSVFYLLADIAEEGFQLEVLPYVVGRDRDALLQRRLSQYYYNTPLSTAISLGRATTGRRDEKLLFAALTPIELFAPWLDTLRETQAMLAGVYSVPLVLTGCGIRILGESGPVLLVTLTRGGVRQTFFDQGKLHFSRLSPLATHRLDEIGRAFANDSAKIYQYLIAQRQLPLGTALRTAVLAHGTQIAELRDFCQDTDELLFEFIDIADTARQLGLKDIPSDSDGGTLLVHCLAATPPKQQFAAASETRYYKLRQIRFALTTAAWVLVAGCLTIAAKAGLNLYELDEQIKATKAITATDTQRYKAILDSLPRTSLTAENLRALIGRFEALQHRTPAMEPLLIHLSKALTGSPKIELVRLAWHASARPDADGSTPKIQGQAGGAAAAAQTEAAGTNSRVVIELEAQLPLSLISDQRGQFEMIEGFAARLRDSRTEVRILSRPFDIESDKPLKSIGEVQSANVPKFGVRVARLVSDATGNPVRTP